MNPEFNLVTENEFKTNLEKVMDSKGLGYILNCIVDICNEKGQHVSENWQDNALASAWNKTAAKIEKCMPSLEGCCPLW